MPLVVADRVRETTTTTGTGTVTLAGAVDGYQSFSAIGNGNTTYYTINLGSQWEVGIGTYLGAGPTLSRDTVLESSNSGSLVDFAAGTKDVFIAYPAEKSISDGYGLLPPANGGTGLTSVGTAGNVLTSDGTVWTSSPPAAGGITYTTVKTSNFTAAANDGVQTDTSGGAFTVTLPATPSVGDQVFVVDSAGSWATNNLTVGRNGSTIDGLSEDLICNISSVSVQFVYSGTTWDVFAQVGGAGAGVVSVAGGGTGVSTLTGYVKGSGTSPLTASATIPTSDLTGTLGVANGGTGATTLTANNVLLGNGTSALQTVAPGTTGNVLTSDGTTWTSAPADTGAIELISTAVASATTNVDFTNLSSDYAEYVLIISNLYVTTLTTLEMYTSSNNGSTYASSANNYKRNAISCNNSGAVSGSSTSTTSISLGQVISPGYATYLAVKMVNAGLSFPFSVEATRGAFISTGYQDRIVGFRDSTTAVNAIRLTAGANNLFGTFRLYGIKAT